MDKRKNNGGYRPGAGRKKGEYQKIHFMLLANIADAAKVILQPAVDALNRGEKFKIVECHPEENNG